MTDTPIKESLPELPKEGRIFGDTADLSGYRRALRHARPLVRKTYDNDPKPGFGDEIDTSCRPLFETLGVGKSTTKNPEKALRLRQQKAQEEGYAAGLAAAQETIATMNSRYQEAIQELKAAQEEIRSVTETDVVNLALLISREAVRNDSSARKHFTEKMVTHCLSQLRSADKITLRVHAEDLNNVKEQYPDLISDETVVRLVADSSLELGGVIAECSLGRVDASFDRRITDIAQNLLDQDSVIRPKPERPDSSAEFEDSNGIENLDGSSNHDASALDVAPETTQDALDSPVEPEEGDDGLE